MVTCPSVETYNQIKELEIFQKIRLQYCMTQLLKFLILWIKKKSLIKISQRTFI